MIKLKKCKKCEVEKSHTLFYSHPYTKDNLQNKCKDCHKDNINKNRNKKIEYYRKYDRDRDRTEKRQITQNRYRKSKKGLATQNEASKRTQARNPKKFKARCAVGAAKRSGKLIVENCKKCNSNENIEAHHHDYDKPLDIIWLCRKCHRELHNEF